MKTRRNDVIIRAGLGGRSFGYEMNGGRERRSSIGWHYRNIGAKVVMKIRRMRRRRRRSKPVLRKRRTRSSLRQSSVWHPWPTRNVDISLGKIIRIPTKKISSSLTNSMKVRNAISSRQCSLIWLTQIISIGNVLPECRGTMKLSSLLDKQQETVHDISFNDGISTRFVLIFSSSSPWSVWSRF